MNAVSRWVWIAILSVNMRAEAPESGRYDGGKKTRKYDRTINELLI
jgi:hypothetical protein